MAISHTIIDRRCLALHIAVAEKLRQDPDLLRVAKENLRRWTRPDGTLPPALQEWRDLLRTHSLQDILRLLCDPGDKATVLRESSPFGGVLSESERLDILRQYEPRAA